ncbi:MAG: hypothetical protein RI932_2045, partial [Pseudomonadota bacterium]
MKGVLFSILLVVASLLCGSKTAEAASARTIRRAAQLLGARMPSEAEIKATLGNQNAYKGYVRSLISSDGFYEAMLRYHERQFGVGLPQEYLDELMRDDLDGTSQKLATLTCNRLPSNRLSCGWKNVDKRTVSTCKAAEQQPVAPFWKQGLVLWVCPSVTYACGADLSKCAVEFPNSNEARHSELGTTDVFDSKRSVLKSLSRQ